MMWKRASPLNDWLISHDSWIVSIFLDKYPCLDLVRRIRDPLLWNKWWSFAFPGANCRTAREEQGDETEEFIKLFGPSLTYTAGARTLSGRQNWFLAELWIRIHWIRIRIRVRIKTWSSVLMTKNWWKKIQLKIFCGSFFDQKLQFTSLGLHKGRQRYRRSLQPSKENIQYLKNEIY